MKIIYSKLTLCLLVISGCASSYKISPETIRIKENMSPQSALRTFSTSLRPGKNTAGICGFDGLLVDKNERVKFTNTGFQVRSYKFGDQTGSEVTLGIETKVFEKKYKFERFQFKELTKLRVLVNSNGNFCNRQSKGDYIILAYRSFATTAILDIAAGDLDKILAAFMVLAPQAEIITGFGI